MAGDGGTYNLKIMCTECGQVWSPGVRLQPGITTDFSGSNFGCPRCMTLIEIPDGTYGVLDGAVRWLRNFSTPESRAHLVETLKEAREALVEGADAESVAKQIASRTGVPIWPFLSSPNGTALLSVVSLMLAILLWVVPPPYEWSDERPPEPAPTVIVEQVTDVAVTVIVPGHRPDEAAADPERPHHKPSPGPG